MAIIKGKYIGPIEQLKDETALIRYDESGQLLAQFDNMRLKYHGRSLGFNWHPFDKKDFKTRNLSKDDGSECRYET